MLTLDECPPEWTNPAFSFAQALLASLENALDDPTQDIGPVVFPEEMTYPLSNVDLPQEQEDEPKLDDIDPFGGASPLSTPPSSPQQPHVDLPQDPEEEREVDGSLPPTSTQNSLKQKGNIRSRAFRTDKRRKVREDHFEETQTPQTHSLETHAENADAEQARWGAQSIPSTSTGYTATLDDSGGVYTLPELLSMGFKLVEWDGRRAKPIVDTNHLVIAVLVGRPNDPSWDRVHEEALSLLQQNFAACNFTSESMDHRRGKFAAVNVGISHGGGPKKPGNLTNTKARTAVLEKLLKSKPFVRLGHFASSALATWMPNLHEHFKACLTAITDHHPKLTKNFPRSAWAAAAFNFGPQTITALHRDSTNLPYGVCSVAALGHYDYKKGGHLILWELKLVIEFPPGSTVLIPSAAIAHGNTPIAAHETRCSFTQYFPGGLFRWVDQGFKKKPKPRKSKSTAAAAAQTKEDELNKARCALGLSMFSTLEELLKPLRKGTTSTPSPAASNPNAG